MIENDETTMREDDDYAKIKEAASSSEKKVVIAEKFSVGGAIDTPALCLLDGIQESDGEENNTKEAVRKTVQIKRLPAVLGRRHPTVRESKKFVDLGKARALSREHARIEYRVATTASGDTGQLVSKVNAGQLVSKVNAAAHPQDDGDDDSFYFTRGDPLKVEEIIKGNDDEVLPSTGFYVITCLGKNRIIVNGKRIEQDQTAHIKSGDAIRISSFCLYFLTPTEGYHKTMSVRNDDVSPLKKKRRISLADKVSSAIPSVAGSGLAAGTGTATTTSGAKRNQTVMQTEIDAMSTKQLLHQMWVAMAANIWDRRHQLIGSTISQRAVVAAARDLTANGNNNNELSRGEIMDWIADSDRFGEWVEQMLTKMEAKSYQASITKALIKAGFQRTASTGRYIKWIVPDLGEESEKDGDSDSDEGGGSDEDNVDEKGEKGLDGNKKETAAVFGNAKTDEDLEEEQIGDESNDAKIANDFARGENRPGEDGNTDA